VLTNKLTSAQPRTRPTFHSHAHTGRIVVDSQQQANDVRKAKQCVKFVGDGCAGSYTDFYRRAVGDLGNCSSYLPGDRVYVSVNGDREGRVRPVDAQVRRSILAILSGLCG